MINKIACYGAGGISARVYWLGGHVMETGYGTDGRWFTNDLGSDIVPVDPKYNSSIACFGVNDQLSRVYYVGDLGFPAELVFATETNKWVINDLGENQGAPAVSSGSGIACLGIKRVLSRVYYFDRNEKVVELAYISQNVPWRTTTIGDMTGAPLTGPTRNIVCFAAGGYASRVYYFDQHGNVIELAWGDDNAWHASNIIKLAGAPPAALNSDIAAFGITGGTSRVYYVDGGGNVVELSYGGNNWVATSVGPMAGAPPAFSPTGIACFGVGGTASRVYYFDVQRNLVELGWGPDNQWHWTDLTAAGNAPQENGPLTCFGVEGVSTRVYYQAGSPPQLWEVGFLDGRWYAQVIHQ
jgi:hypothetical protein